MFDKPLSAPSPLSRRHFLWQTGGGLGAIALAWMLERDARGSTTPLAASLPASPVVTPHQVARAKRVVQIFCLGGVSQVDTFDYKPALEKFHGRPLPMGGENLGFFGQPGNVMKSPFAFAQHGQSGAWISSLFPHLAKVADELTFIRSMVAKSNNHTPATFQMNSGFTLNGFPSMGAWVSYGLGSENEGLPAYVVLPDPRGMPAGGSINWTAGFLPASYQGVAFGTSGAEPIADLQTPPDVSTVARQAGLGLLNQMNRAYAEQDPADSMLSARLRSYELAARMQMSVPDAVDLSTETESTRRMYGMDRPATQGMGRNCLMARRLLERGVRFVQLYNGGAFGSPRINWDGHENVIDNHTMMAAGIDQPVAGLISDLKQRGLLDDTLVIWCTEFGRGPATQGIGSTGRDHHPNVFTCFLAGGGVKRGLGYGASDELGYTAAENPVTTYDFHATILHLLGLDHTKLTYYHNGIRRRLTDVHGNVVGGIIA